MNDLIVLLFGEAAIAAVVFIVFRFCRDGERPAAGGNAGAGAQEATRSQARAQPAAVVELPYFPYAPPPRQGGGGSGSAAPSERLVCAICLERLRRGDLCSEVPACRHVFHRDCVGAWMKSNDTCPLCRAKITPLISAAPPVADMV